MKRRYLVASLWPALLLARNVAASADAPAATAPHRDTVETARTHFQRGVDLYRAAAYDAALAEFTRAYDSAPNYRILYNLAQIQAQRHDYVASLQLFRRYLEDGAAYVPVARAEAVTGEIAELERRVAQLHVSTNVDDARLFVDDMPAAELPLEAPLLVNAGIHQLRIEKSGRPPAFRTVTLTGGDALALTVDLDAPVEVDPPPATPALQPRATLSPPPLNMTPFWLSLAATGALTGASATFALLTHQANAQLDRQLEQYPAPRAAIDKTRDRVRTYAVTTDAIGLASALAAGITTYFYFSATAEPEQGQHGVSLKAQLGPTRAGLACTGTF
jgi:PEGA domain